ncbi:MAG: YabP/YqfC family sporulation protein [Clostridia bacterium]|nr:YabP/YqfC family sporulation protein [Clostridia bacterium]
MKKKKPLPIPKINKSSVEIDGNKEVLICGCKGLEHYSETSVMIAVPEGRINVCGENMTMRWAGAGKLLVCGKIYSVTLDEVNDGKNI